MKNFRKWITSPIATVALFVLAAVLLAFSTIGGARAAFIAYSETYVGHVEVVDIGVSLIEKSAQDSAARVVAFRNYIKNSKDEWDETPTEDHIGVLLGNLLAKDSNGNYTEELVPGKAYTEEIGAANTGTINQYVRISIYKYWLDPNGNKVIAYDGGRNLTANPLPSGMSMADSAESMTTYGLSPDLIHLEYANLDDGSGNGSWILDKKESSETEERTVFYYNKLLKSGEDTADTPLTSTLTIDKSVADKVSQKTVETEEGGSKVIRTTYVYDGWQFCLEAQVDAVQENNAVDAIRSAWGREVSFRDNGTLKLEDE